MECIDSLIKSGYLGVSSAAFLLRQASQGSSGDRFKEGVEKKDQSEKGELVLSQYDIEKLIVTVRGEQVLIDRDLAMIYGIETKRLNEQVKRNIARFPERYRFQLTKDEMTELVANCDRFKTLKHSTTTPYAFTEYLGNSFI